MKFIFAFIILLTAASASLFYHYKNADNPTQIPRAVIVYDSSDNEDLEMHEELE